MEGKTQFSKAQIVSLVAVFLLGTSILIPPGQNLGKHAWISLTISYGLFLLLLGLYYLLANLEPKKSLFALHEQAFGKYIGAVVNVFYLIYFFILATLITANFVNFINSAILVNTPDMVVSALLVVVLAYITRSGLRAIAKLSELMLIFVLVSVVLVTIMLISRLDISNFLPIVPSNWNDILLSSFSNFSFPFGESVVFLGVLCLLGKPDKVFRGLSRGGLIALLALLVVVLRNTAVLGEFAAMTSYPSFETARLINIGQVLTRAEVLIALSFIITGFLKGSITYYSLCRGIKETFHLKSYKHMVIPIGALLAISSHLSFPTILQNQHFNAEIYSYYAVIPQVILVLLTYLVLLFKKRWAAK